VVVVKRIITRSKLDAIKQVRYMLRKQVDKSERSSHGFFALEYTLCLLLNFIS